MNLFELEEITITYLKIHWGSAYDVRYRRGQFEAARRDGKGTLTASDAEELRKLIQADYAHERVPRLMPVCHCGQQDTE
jgi:hypothetical protein